MIERRAPRIRAAVGVILRQDALTEPCLTKSVSVTGLAVSTKKQWDQEKPMQVDIIEDGYRLSTSSRVVRQLDNLVTLEFDQENPNVEPVMSGLMEWLLERTGSNPQHMDLSDLENLDGKVKWTPVEKRGFKPFVKRFSEAEISEISHEGASFIARRSPDVGEELFIILQHDERTDSLLKVQAKVVRHLPRGFAVQLDSPSREVRSWISKMRRYRRLDE